MDDDVVVVNACHVLHVRCCPYGHDVAEVKRDFTLHKRDERA